MAWEKIYIKAIDSLDDPRAIFKNKNADECLILTVVKDKNNNNIIVPIQIETSTNVNYEKQNGIDLNDYIKNNIKDSKFEKIYEQKKRKVRALAPQLSLIIVYQHQIIMSILLIIILCRIMQIILDFLLQVKKE